MSYCECEEGPDDPLNIGACIKCHKSSAVMRLEVGLFRPDVKIIDFIHSAFEEEKDES